MSKKLESKITWNDSEQQAWVWDKSKQDAWNCENWERLAMETAVKVKIKAFENPPDAWESENWEELAMEVALKERANEPGGTDPCLQARKAQKSTEALSASPTTIDTKSAPGKKVDVKKVAGNGKK
ncbi:hypothetical protein ACEPPN_005433 [Leptodophora sp. 'Broadleaf-Isolate-01']